MTISLDISLLVPEVVSRHLVSLIASLRRIQSSVEAHAMQTGYRKNGLFGISVRFLTPLEVILFPDIFFAGTSMSKMHTWCGVNGRISRISCLALVHPYINRCLPLLSLPLIWGEGWRENGYSLLPSVPGM